MCLSNELAANYEIWTTCYHVIDCLFSLLGIDLNEARRGEELKMMEDANKWIATGNYEEVPHPTTGATGLHVAACKGYIKVLE